MATSTINKLTIVLPFVFATHALSQNIPAGYTVPDMTVSPDNHYGVTLPIRNENDAADKLDDRHNSLVDMTDGHVIAVIQAQTGWSLPYGHFEVLPPHWSSDRSLLLWEVNRKWNPAVLLLLKINQDKVAWQADILRAARQTILACTKKAAPGKYAAAKKTKVEMADGYHGEHSDYPEGFTIDVKVVEPVALPLHVEAVLTSDPKSYTEGDDVLNSYLDGTIDARGKFTVTSFHLGYRTWDRF